MYKIKQMNRGEDSDDQMLDEEDLDLIKENRTQKRKLKKIAEGINDESGADNEWEQRTQQKAVKVEEDKKRNEALIKKNIFEKRAETTATDDEAKLDVGKSLKDKFITEDIDELFGTLQD